MAKKTLAQKKRSDERRGVSPIAPYTEAAPTPLPTSEVSIGGLSLETNNRPSTEGKVTSPSYPFLKKDLLKVGALAVGALMLEYVVSYAVKHGALSSWGIS